MPAAPVCAPPWVEVAAAAVVVSMVWWWPSSSRSSSRSRSLAHLIEEHGVEQPKLKRLGRHRGLGTVRAARLLLADPFLVVAERGRGQGGEGVGWCGQPRMRSGLAGAAAVLLAVAVAGGGWRHGAHSARALLEGEGARRTSELGRARPITPSRKLACRRLRSSHSVRQTQHDAAGEGGGWAGGRVGVASFGRGHGAKRGGVIDGADMT